MFIELTTKTGKVLLNKSHILSVGVPEQKGDGYSTCVTFSGAKFPCYVKESYEYVKSELCKVLVLVSSGT